MKEKQIDDAKFTSDITVSLSGGKTFGKYSNGQVIPATGKTANQVLLDVAVEDIAPVYVIATEVLTATGALDGEVGESLNVTNITNTFTQHDAGALSAIRIYKNAVILASGSTSPFVVASDAIVRINGSITYSGQADYAAGVIKNYTPSGTPDGRTPQIRSVNAPQAAENGFASNTVVFQGHYRYFYGSSASAVNDSASVRALSNNPLSSVAGSTFILNTGNVNTIFAVAVPATHTLTSVIDLDALNANITSNYVLSTFNVLDAGGANVSYHVYVLTAGVPYSSSHRHQITIS